MTGCNCQACTSPHFLSSGNEQMRYCTRAWPHTHLAVCCRQLPKGLQLALGCSQVKGLVQLPSQQQELNSQLHFPCASMSVVTPEHAVLPYV